MAKCEARKKKDPPWSSDSQVKATSPDRPTAMSPVPNDIYTTCGKHRVPAHNLLHQQTLKANHWVSFHYQVDIRPWQQKQRTQVSPHDIMASWEHGKKISLPRWEPFLFLGSQDLKERLWPMPLVTNEYFYTLSWPWELRFLLCKWKIHNMISKHCTIVQARGTRYV